MSSCKAEKQKMMSEAEVDRQMMLLKHRCDERRRHHDINSTMQHLFDFVPTPQYTGKETKISKLRRAIRYCAYLELQVDGLCKELGLCVDADYNCVSTYLLKAAQNGKKVNNRSSRIPK